MSTEIIASENLLNRQVPTVGVVFGPDGVSGIETPILLYRSGQDEALSYPYHAENIPRHLVIKHEYQVEEEADHYAYITPFPSSLENSVGPASRDPEGFDRERFVNRLATEIKSFFDHVL